MTVFDRVAKTCFVALLLSTPSGCDGPGGHQQHRQAGSADAAQVQSLDVYVDQNTMHLLTGEYRAREKTRTLWHRRSVDGGKTWTEPVRVDAGAQPVHGFERGNDAQIAAIGQRLIAVWTTLGSGWGGSGPLAVAVSEDGGKTWQAQLNPADDNSTGGHAFIDLIADRNGMFHLVWLDDRNGSQGLRYTQSSDAATWIPNRSLDRKTCECCWNTLFGGAENLYALYRGNDPRDMRLAVSTDSGLAWKQSGQVGAFGWKINACPHAGGALASSGGRLHALVWTGRDGAPGLYHLHSADSGKRWSEPRRLGSEDAKHADLATAGREKLAAVWDEASDGDSAIFGARSEDGGATWSTPRRLSDFGANATHPRIVFSAGEYRVLWTEGRKNEDTVWETRTFGSH
ncbi:MAG: exo-alpha-sialidase [Burkholderiales bacterium]|nr:exo-alpha-sialidase [Burkholderiales bacterium]